MNKIKIFLPVFLLVVVGMLALSSCEKAEVTPSSSLEKSAEAEKTATIESYDNLTVADMPQLEVRDGMLYFANSEQYFKTIAIVGKMTDEQLDQWEQELGFVSLRTMQNKALEELNTMEADEELYPFIKKYDYLFELTECENGEQEMNLKIDDQKFASICNTISLFVINKQANKVIGINIVSTGLENLDKLKQIKSIENIDENMFSTYMYRQNKDTKYYDTKTAIYIKNKSGCVNDRKVKLSIIIDALSYQNITTIKAGVIVRGYKKIGCIWVSYNTVLSYRDVSGRVNYLYNSEKMFSFRDRSSGSGVSKIEDWYTIYNGYTGQHQLYFKEANGEASSRGVGSNWAIIKYPNN